METETQRPERCCGVVAVSKTPNRIEFAYAEDIAYTATDFDVRNG